MSKASAIKFFSALNSGGWLFVENKKTAAAIFIVDNSKFFLGKASYNCILLSLSALVMTDTELNVIAALAMIGLSKTPKNG